MTHAKHRDLTGSFRNRLGSFGVTAVIGLFGGTALMQQCAPPPPPPPIVHVQGVQSNVVNSVNQQRANAGIGGVTVDARLTNAAQSHANDMANRRVMTHTGANGSNGGQRITAQGYGWSRWAENVAAGQTTPEQVMNAWMNSSGHRANILDGRLVNIGVAAATGSDGVTYWAMVLGA